MKPIGEKGSWSCFNKIVKGACAPLQWIGALKPKIAGAQKCGGKPWRTA